MQICTSCNGTYSPSAGARIDGAATAGRIRESVAAEAANPLFYRAADSVDISSAARELSDRLPVAKIRADLVEQIRGEIAAGTYEADDGKLDVAADQLLGRLNITG
ncbi:MAG: flagellar biosynthesis anti-sigma factor FlgM [Phycisphaerales bacterium]